MVVHVQRPINSCQARLDWVWSDTSLIQMRWMCSICFAFQQCWPFLEKLQHRYQNTETLKTSFFYQSCFCPLALALAGQTRWRSVPGVAPGPWHSTILYHDQNRNQNMINRDHLVGRPTTWSPAPACGQLGHDQATILRRELIGLIAVLGNSGHCILVPPLMSWHSI